MILIRQTMLFWNSISTHNMDCCCSVAKSCCWTLCNPWSAARQAPLSSIISWNLLKLMSIESMMLSNYLILCFPFLLLPSIFLSIRVFSKESVLRIRWPKYWSFSISPSNKYSELISFRTDWFWSPCSPKNTQQSSPTPQFKNINSLVLSLLYGPTLTSIHDYWKNHSFDYMDICWQSYIPDF